MAERCRFSGLLVVDGGEITAGYLCSQTGKLIDSPAERKLEDKRKGKS